MGAVEMFEHFLNSYPDGRLIASITSATPVVLAWMAKRIDEERRVDLLVSDCPREPWRLARLPQVDASAEFISRPTVNPKMQRKPWLLSAPKRPPALWTWISEVEGSPVAAVVGSPRLTTRGIDDGHQKVSRVALAEVERLWREMLRLYNTALPASDLLKRRIAAKMSQPVMRHRAASLAAGRQEERH